MGVVGVMSVFCFRCFLCPLFFIILFAMHLSVKLFWNLEDFGSFYMPVKLGIPF